MVPWQRKKAENAKIPNFSVMSIARIIHQIIQAVKPNSFIEVELVEFLLTSIKWRNDLIKMTNRPYSPL